MPRYDYRCVICGSVREESHGFFEEPSFTCCDESMVRLIGAPRVQPSAMPSRGAGAFAVHHNQAEKTLSKDLDAYKRARDDGLQPSQIDGSAAREAVADNVSDYLGAAV